MKCPKCGRVYDDAVTFCPVDDTPLAGGSSGAPNGESEEVRPATVAPFSPPEVDEPAAPAPEPPKMVEPIDEAEQETVVRSRPAHPLNTNLDPRSRMTVPIATVPPPPPYVNARPHPSAAGSNPWKVAFLALIGVLVIGGILFWLLRNNPNAQDSGTPLTSDPSATPLLTTSPPNGNDETTAPPINSPTPYVDTNVNSNINANPTPPVNANINTVPIPPVNANVTPTITPTPRPINQNSNNSNTPPPNPTPHATPGGSPTPRTNSTPRPVPPPGAAP